MAEALEGEPTKRIDVPLRFYRRLEALALRYERTVSDIVRHAVEIQYGEEAASARLRLIDRLARLEARLGDPDELQEQVAKEIRSVRDAEDLPA